MLLVDDQGQIRAISVIVLSAAELCHQNAANYLPEVRDTCGELTNIEEKLITLLSVHGWSYKVI